MKLISTLALFVALLTLPPPVLHGQTARNFKARLSPMPLDLAMAATMTGSGAVSAVLAGSKLTLTGTFEGLVSPATVARLHKAQKGVRGPAVMDLEVSKAMAGTLSATLDLTPQQVLDLQNSRLYIQLHSEKALEGNLWGWLIPQETKR